MRHALQKSVKMEELGRDTSKNVYFIAFEKHYRVLEVGLPMDSLFSTLSSEGLLGETQLRQKITSSTTDTAKARLFLESMRSGLKIGNNEVFIKFVKAMIKYADDNNDRIVKELAGDLCNDLPRPLSGPSERKSTRGNFVKK